MAIEVSASSLMPSAGEGLVAHAIVYSYFYKEQNSSDAYRTGQRGRWV